MPNGISQREQSASMSLPCQCNTKWVSHESNKRRSEIEMTFRISSQYQKQKLALCVCVWRSFTLMKYVLDNTRLVPRPPVPFYNLWLPNITSNFTCSTIPNLGHTSRQTLPHTHTHTQMSPFIIITNSPGIPGLWPANPVRCDWPLQNMKGHDWSQPVW